MDKTTPSRHINDQMKNKLATFYRGEKGGQRLRALQVRIDERILAKAKKTDKIVIWTPLPGLTGAQICPFADNQRPPYGNGALDHIIIIHCFDVTSEAAGVMAEAARMVRDHGIIDVIGWTKPKYDHGLPVWERERHRIALRMLDPRSLKWRRYEKVQDLLTLTFGGQGSSKKVAMPAAVSLRTNVSSRT